MYHSAVVPQLDGESSFLLLHLSNKGLRKITTDPTFMHRPMTRKEAENDPVLSDKTPPIMGPIKLDMAWNSLTNP